MILLSILDHDLHRPRVGMSAAPYMIEVPALPGFVPAIVSNSRGSFIVSRKLTSDGRIRVGVFNHDSNKLDQVLCELVEASLSLSLKEEWQNVFFGKNAAKLALSYIGEKSGMSGAQPHACMVPSSWDPAHIKEFFGAKHFDEETKKYCGYCRVLQANIKVPVFLSRPDMVGMYTQFLGGGSSILLHNVRFGMAFCLNNNDKSIP